MARRAVLGVGRLTLLGLHLCIHDRHGRLGRHARRLRKCPEPDQLSEKRSQDDASGGRAAGCGHGGLPSGVGEELGKLAGSYRRTGQNSFTEPARGAKTDPYRKEPTMKSVRLVLLGLVPTVAVAAGAGVRAAGPPAAPTFNADVAPILFNNCVTCHRPNQIAPPRGPSLRSSSSPRGRNCLPGRLRLSRSFPRPSLAGNLTTTCETAWDNFKSNPVSGIGAAPLVFYINHLAWEIAKAEDVFAPAA